MAEATGAKRPERPALVGCIALWVSGALALLCAVTGCAAAPAQQERSRGPVTRVIYQSLGRIAAVKAVRTAEGERVLIWESIQPPLADGFELHEDWFLPHLGVFRLVSLDLATQQATVHWEVPRYEDVGDLYDALAVSEDGRSFLWVQGRSEWSPGGPLNGTRLLITALEGAEAGPGGEGLPLTPFGDRQYLSPQWSPDSTAIIYGFIDRPDHASRLDWAAFQAAAISVERQRGAPKEVLLTSEDKRSAGFAWARDGRCIYHVTHIPGSEVPYRLEAIQWPSLERRELFQSDSFICPAVARDTGDLLFLVGGANDTGTTGEGTGYAVWRFSRDAMRKTRAPAFPADPLLAAVSPDGQWLDVSPMKRWIAKLPSDAALYICSLADGTWHALADVKAAESATWVLDGRGIIVFQPPSEVLLVDVHGELADVAPFEAEPPNTYPPESDPDGLSRERLSELGAALNMYLREGDGLLPDLADMDAVVHALGEHLWYENAVLDPHTGQPYGVNSDLSRVRIADIEDRLSSLIVFYEAVPGRDGGRFAVLADGRVVHVSADKWQEARSGGLRSLLPKPTPTG